MNFFRKKIMWVLPLVVAVWGFALCPAARAGSDPATLFIGNPPAAGDPNLISTGSVRINQNHGGNVTLDPVLLILAVPNAGSNFFGGVNPITSVTYSNGGTATSVLGGPSLFNGTWDATTGFAGSMTSSPPGQDIYGTIAGLQPPNVDNSNNWTNLSGADLKINGITANNFAIYVFALSDPNGLVSKGHIDVTFGDGTVPVGTFAVAYSQDSGGTPYATPFTEAGLTTPEPASIALGFTGFLALGGFAAYRRRKLSVA